MSDTAERAARAYLSPGCEVVGIKPASRKEAIALVRAKEGEFALQVVKYQGRWVVMAELDAEDWYEFQRGVGI